MARDFSKFNVDNMQRSYMTYVSLANMFAKRIEDNGGRFIGEREERLTYTADNESFQNLLKEFGFGENSKAKRTSRITESESNKER